MFRTLFSTKSDELKPRPLVKSILSDNFDFLESFICYIPNFENSIIFDSKDIAPFVSKKAIFLQKEVSDNKEILLDVHYGQTSETIDISEIEQQELNHKDKDIIKKFVRKNYKYRNQDIKDIIVNKEINFNFSTLTKFYEDFEKEKNNINN